MPRSIENSVVAGGHPSGVVGSQNVEVLGFSGSVRRGVEIRRCCKRSGRGPSERSPGSFQPALLEEAVQLGE